MSEVLATAPSASIAPIGIETEAKRKAEKVTDEPQSHLLELKPSFRDYSFARRRASIAPIGIETSGSGK